MMWALKPRFWGVDNEQVEEHHWTDTHKSAGVFINCPTPSILLFYILWDGHLEGSQTRLDHTQLLIAGDWNRLESWEEDSRWLEEMRKEPYIYLQPQQDGSVDSPAADTTWALVWFHFHVCRYKSCDRACDYHVQQYLVPFSLAETSISWNKKSLLIFLPPSLSSTVSSCLTSSRLNPPLNYRRIRTGKKLNSKW